MSNENKLLEGKDLKEGTEYVITFTDGSTYDLGRFNERKRSGNPAMGQQSRCDNIYVFEKMPPENMKIKGSSFSALDQINSSDGKAVYTVKTNGGKKRIKNRRRKTNKTTRRKKNLNRIKTIRRVQSRVY